MVNSNISKILKKKQPPIYKIYCWNKKNAKMFEHNLLKYFTRTIQQ